MWFVFDGLGCLLGGLTWIFLGFADWVVVRHVLGSWFWTSKPPIAAIPLTTVGLVLAACYQVILFLAWFSHFQAATTDPGTILERQAPDDVQNARNCKLCDSRWKPARAHHCKTCKRCIFRMDHHCPWINNCVGFSNQKFFILFLGYTAVSAGVTLVVLGVSCVSWLWIQPNWSDAAPMSSVSLVCGGLVAVECLAAAVFVSDFLQEQIESITTNSTLVETYQCTHGRRGTFWEHFRQIFGPNTWLWALPIPSTPPADYQEPAIPDDSGSYADGDECLGIAGRESEAPGSSSTEPTLRPRPAAAYAERMQD